MFELDITKTHTVSDKQDARTDGSYTNLLEGNLGIGPQTQDEEAGYKEQTSPDVSNQHKTKPISYYFL